MKLLSQFTAGEAVDVLATITEPAMSIMLDEKIMEQLKKATPDETPTVAQARVIGMGKIVSIVTLVAQEHKADLFALFAPFFETTETQLAAMPLLAFCKGIAEVIKDKEFTDFLSLWQADTEENSSSVPLQAVTGAAAEA